MTDVQEEIIKKTELKIVEASPRITRIKDVDPLESVSSQVTVYNILRHLHWY